MSMRAWFAALVVVLALAMGAGCAIADTVKVGVIAPLSGPFSLYGKNFKAGIDAYVAMHGDKVGDHQVEFVWRDLDGPNPGQAKALAQELVIKEHVQYLAGVVFTPNALAIAPILEPAKVPFVIFNAATSIITEKSPYIVRSSFTLAQVTVPMAQVAARRGIKRVVTTVSDYGPGIDAETAFKKRFEAEGGAVVESIRMPIKTTDFAPFMQRIRDAGADAVFAFLPSGPPTLGFVKAFLDNGLRERGIQFLCTGDLTPEPDLQVLGDAAIGILSTFHYATSHQSPVNAKFLEAIAKVMGSTREVTFPAVGAFDGTHVLYKMIEATDGKQEPDKAVAAVKGLAWESPRGPVMIDPATRHIRQNVYLRVVAKEGDAFVNKEIETFPDQPDWGLADAQ